MPDIANFFITRHPNKRSSKSQGLQLGVHVVGKYSEKFDPVRQLKYSAKKCNVEGLLGQTEKYIFSISKVFDEAEDLLQIEIENRNEKEEVHDLEARTRIDLELNAVQAAIMQKQFRLKWFHPKKDASQIKVFEEQINTLEAQKLDLQEELRLVNEERQIPKSNQQNLYESIVFVKEASDYLCSICDSRAGEKQAKKFLFKNKQQIKELERILIILRVYISTILVSLKIHKLSTNPNYLDYRCLLKTVDVLLQLSEQNGDLFEINTKQICNTMNSPVIFPSWVNEFSPCKCSNEDGEVKGRELESHPKKMQEKIRKYRKDLEGAKDRCKEGKTECAQLEDCQCDECCIPQNPCCIELHSYVTDLMTIRQTLECYRPGELAHIQNVMGGEELSRTHESMRETEEYTEEETTTRREEEHDHQTSERFEEQEAVQKTIAQDFAADAGITTSGKYGPPANRTKVNTSANVSYSRSQSEAKQTAKNYAKDVVQRSIMKIQEETRKLSSRRVLRRITETNVHSFKGASNHTIGQYYWVNKISSAQVVNWGKRMMYDFVIPEPQKLYQYLMKKKQEAAQSKIKEKRRAQVKQYPEIDFSVVEISFEKIKPGTSNTSNTSNPNFYRTLCERYDIFDPPKPPEREIILTFAKHISETQRIHAEGQAFAFAQKVSIPDGYTVNEVAGRGYGEQYSDNPSIMMNVSGQTQNIKGTNGGVIDNLEIDGGNTLDIVGFAKGIQGLTVSGEIRCSVNSSTVAEWQNEIMGLIKDKVSPEQDPFEDEEFEPLSQIRGRNPFFNRETEKTELWRLVVSMISCQHFDDFGAMKHKVEPCGHPQLDFQQAQEEGAFIKFFEQVFEKEQMMYLFYPSFWGSKCDCINKIEVDSGDVLFDKFLSCGAVHVKVPVREGFEAQALHYEQHGEIWLGNGQPDMDPNSPHFLAMHEEFRSQSGNFSADREGLVDFDFTYLDDNDNPITNDGTIISIHGTDQWWDWSASSSFPGEFGDEDDLAIQDDIDREIIINRISYRIVDIELYRGKDDAGSGGNKWVPTNASDNNAAFIKNMRWIVTLERIAERPDTPPGTPPPVMKNMMYSTGGILVDSSWEIATPTNLVWLRPEGADGYENCLPCYPLDC